MIISAGCAQPPVPRSVLEVPVLASERSRARAQGSVLAPERRRARAQPSASAAERERRNPERERSRSERERSGARAQAERRIRSAARAPAQPCSAVLRHPSPGQLAGPSSRPGPPTGRTKSVCRPGRPAGPSLGVRERCGWLLQLVGASRHCPDHLRVLGEPLASALRFRRTDQIEY